MSLEDSSVFTVISPAWHAGISVDPHLGLQAGVARAV